MAGSAALAGCAQPGSKRICWDCHIFFFCQFFQFGIILNSETEVIFLGYVQLILVRLANAASKLLFFYTNKSLSQIFFGIEH